MHASRKKTNLKSSNELIITKTKNEAYSFFWITCVCLRASLSWLSTPVKTFYGAEGSTDMVGPQSYLANEADRLWVAVYDGFSRMAVPLFIIVSAFLLAPMKAGLTSWQFYRQRCIRILPPFFIFMILYSTLPLLWGQIDAETSLKDISRIFLNFPSQAGHLWFMYPLISLYLFIPVISPWLNKATAKEERFFIGLFLLSTCMPISIVASARCGDNVFGTNTIYCGTSPVI